MAPRYRIALLALLVLLVAGPAARASTVSYHASVPLQPTDWSSTLTLPRFDPSLGTLTSVALEVRDSLVHKIEYENKAASTSRFRDSTYVTVNVLRPNSTPLATAVAKIYRTATLGVFDGTVDYAGTSGVTYDGIVDVATGSVTTSDPVDLALFSGSGTIDLPCQALAYFLFSYSGGNATYILTTQAQAYATITYTFDTVVPTRAATWGRIKSLYR